MFDVPRSELDAAVSYTPPLDLQLLLPKFIPHIHLALLASTAVAGAAAIAVEKVNADDTLLAGYVVQLELQLEPLLGCSAQQGLAAMGELLQGDSHIDAVIGPGCSSACEVTSYFSGGQEIPQISHSCTSPSLSNKAEYNLVRTVGLRLRISCF